MCLVRRIFWGATQFSPATRFSRNAPVHKQKSYFLCTFAAVSAQKTHGCHMPPEMMGSGRGGGCWKAGASLQKQRGNRAAPVRIHHHVAAWNPPLPLLLNPPTPALISLLHVHPVNLHGGKREEEKKEKKEKERRKRRRRRKRCAAFAHLKMLQKPDMFGNLL